MPNSATTLLPASATLPSTSVVPVVMTIPSTNQVNHMGESNNSNMLSSVPPPTSDTNIACIDEVTVGATESMENSGNIVLIQYQSYVALHI